MIPIWFQNDLKVIPKFVYYSPGDRAQEVIPGGAKTNESFWKSQNNIKKTILRFPSFLLTIALVIERNKLSPEARKKNESLWKSQNNVKKTISRFPIFLFTIALVIERNKLSPEARKQTRASESLKMTSKSQLFVSHQT